ncbi:MAG: hypothetical protein R3E53_18410 [Myxococcota bacterium]
MTSKAADATARAAESVRVVAAGVTGIAVEPIVQGDHTVEPISRGTAGPMVGDDGPMRPTQAHLGVDRFAPLLVREAHDCGQDDTFVRVDRRLDQVDEDREPARHGRALLSIDDESDALVVRGQEEGAGSSRTTRWSCVFSGS